jgi:hypothetical protein
MTVILESDALGAHYDAMWTEAAATLQAGGATLDPQVVGLADDARRGVTLLARPAAAVAGPLSAFCECYSVVNREYGRLLSEVVTSPVSPPDAKPLRTSRLPA